MATLAPSVGDVYTLAFYHKTQITADDTTGVTSKVPFKGRIIGALASVEAIGGSTAPTDVDIVVKDGSTTIATLAAVDSSAIVSGGGLDTSINYQVDAGDVVEVEIDITGGSSPTVDGIFTQLWIVRE